MKLNSVEETKLVIIRGSGNIRELGNICAPVLTPQRVALSKIAKIISGGRVVMEVNPDNRNEMVKLTISNLRQNNFPKADVAADPAPVTAEPAKVEEKKVTTPAPVVKKEEKKPEVKAEPAKVEEKKADAKPASDFATK